MRLMPLWIILLVFVTAILDANTPGVEIIETLSSPWIEALLVGAGLGGIPLSMFKRVVSAAKEAKENIT
jgi:hypothetical protein